MNYNNTKENKKYNAKNITIIIYFYYIIYYIYIIFYYIY